MISVGTYTICLDAILSYNFGSRDIFVNKVLMEKIKPHSIWRLN